MQTILSLALVLTTTTLAAPVKRVVNGFDLDGAIKSVVYVKSHALCTGSLLTSNLVLTAAHCIDEGYPITVSIPTDIPQGDILKLPNGMVDVNQAVFQVSKSWIHPLYSERSYDYDIALLQLSSSVLENSNAKVTVDDFFSLDYPYTNISYSDTSKAFLMNCGFGSTASSTLEDTRFGGKVPFQCTVGTLSSNSQECKNQHDKVALKNGKFSTVPWPTREVCGIFSDSTACSGDSGGPSWIMVNKKSNKVYTFQDVANGLLEKVPEEDLDAVQVGIAGFVAGKSITEEGQETCFKGFTAYTSVSSYYPIIASAICESSTSKYPDTVKACETATLKRKDVESRLGEKFVDIPKLRAWKILNSQGLVE